MKIFVAAGLLVAAFAAVEVRGAVVICQFASWAVYRNEGGKVTPSDLDADLCTHGVYVFAGLTAADELAPLDPWADLETEGGMGGYMKYIALKENNPNFKALLGLGGWANAASQYAAIAASATRRVKLAQNAVSFLKTYGFDGLEVDWLYPATANEKKNFPLMLAELRKAFEPEGFQLIANVAATEEGINTSYNLTGLAESLDYFVIMGYDYEGSWNPETGLSTPLYRENSTLCVNTTVQAYLKRGVDPAQLVLGVPGFGHTYTLADETKNGIGAEIVGPGDGGPYTITAGILSYNEIVEDLSSWTVRRDSLSQAPYAYKGNQWVSYDDETSIKFKVAYMKTHKLAGAAMWTVDEDKFVDGAFPLLKALNTLLD